MADRVTQLQEAVNQVFSDSTHNNYYDTVQLFSFWIFLSWVNIFVIVLVSFKPVQIQRSKMVGKWGGFILTIYLILSLPPGQTLKKALRVSSCMSISSNGED